MNIFIYVVLCLINLVICFFYLETDGESNGNHNLENAIRKLYLLITFPMLIYTIYLLIYIYTRKSGVYTIFIIKVFATIIFGLILIGIILKLINIIVEKIYCYCYPLFLSSIISSLLALVFSMTLVSGMDDVYNESKLFVDKISFNSIEFKENLDEDSDKSMVAYIITDKGKEEVIIGDYVLHELDKNIKGKYILKYSVKKKYETLVETKTNEINYEYVIYTDDANEYTDLYRLYTDEVIDDFVKGSI